MTKTSLFTIAFGLLTYDLSQKFPVKFSKFFKFCTVLISLSIYSMPSQAETYQGFISDIPIVVELDFYDSQVSGRYFYKKHLIDIPLIGSLDAGWITLIENEENQQGMSLSIQYTDGENYYLEGEWFDRLRGKSLPIKLELVNTEDLIPTESEAINNMAEESNYSFLRHANIKYQEIKTEAFEDNPVMSLVWLQDKKSKGEFFAIKSNDTYKQVKKTNSHIEQKFRNFSEAFYSNGSADIIFKPQFANNNVISYSILGSIYYPSTPHPSHIYEHSTLHIPSARPIAFEDIISIPDTQEKASWIMSQLLQIAPKEMQVVEECDYMNVELWQIDSFSGWYLTNKGIHLSPHFSHAASPCSLPEWAILPMSLVKEHPGIVSIE